MPFPQKHLYNDEQIVLDRNPHWWYLAPRAFLLVAASVLGILALVYLDDRNSSWQSGLKWIAGAAMSVFLVELDAMIARVEAACERLRIAASDPGLSTQRARTISSNRRKMRQTLMRLGLPESALLITVVHDENGENSFVAFDKAEEEAIIRKFAGGAFFVREAGLAASLLVARGAFFVFFVAIVKLHPAGALPAGRVA